MIGTAILVVLAAAPIQLDALANEATVIAFGRVTSLRPMGDVRTADLDVTVQLKGAPQATLTFVAERLGCCQPVAILGGNALYFLRPSQTPGVLRVAGEGRGVFSLGFLKGEAFVAVPPSDVGLDPRLWAGDGGDDSFARPVRATALIQALGSSAAPPKGPPRGTATFQLAELSCAKCSLETSLAPLLSADAVNCGVARAPGSPELACFLSAWAKRHPFRVGQLPAGIDSSIEQWFVGGRDGGVTLLQYDSDTGGGLNLCHAAVFARPCARVSIRKSPRSGSFIECEGAGEFAAICKETERTTEVLTAPRPASLLRCGSGSRREYQYCSEHADSSHKVVPALDGGNYLCTPSSSGGMGCRGE